MVIIDPIELGSGNLSSASDQDFLSGCNSCGSDDLGLLSVSLGFDVVGVGVDDGSSGGNIGVSIFLVGTVVDEVGSSSEPGLLVAGLVSCCDANQILIDDSVGLALLDS